MEKESFETKSALARAEDEVDSSKNRCQTLSTRNVDLARENTQHKVRGEVLEEENTIFGRQIEVRLCLLIADYSIAISRFSGTS